MCTRASDRTAASSLGAPRALATRPRLRDTGARTRASARTAAPSLAAAKCSPGAPHSIDTSVYTTMLSALWACRSTLRCHLKSQTTIRPRPRPHRSLRLRPGPEPEFEVRLRNAPGLARATPTLPPTHSTLTRCVVAQMITIIGSCTSTKLATATPVPTTRKVTTTTTTTVTTITTTTTTAASGGDRTPRRR